MGRRGKGQTGVDEGQGEDTVMVLRPVRNIAQEIWLDWKKPYFGAVPYLEAMQSLCSIEEHYGQDSGKSIVLYFLANAGSWRGEVARRVKRELNEMCV